MTAPSNLATTQLSQQLVAITSVDPASMTASGYTRQQDQLMIDIRYPVGAIHVIPCVGEQWVVKKVGMNWALAIKLPKNTNILLNVASTPVQGMVQIGSSGVGSGPLVLDGSELTINAPIPVLPIGESLYRDNGGVLQFSTDGGSTWTPVASTGGSGASGTLIIGEVPAPPSGQTQNGVVTTFTLSQHFLAGSTAVYRNGLRERLNAGYSETQPNQIVFSNAPLAGDSLEVDYILAGST